MDSALSTAARALASGDPLQALKFVALRGDAPSLALRGIAMAQLGELARARTLLRRAAAAFSGAEPVARARCVVAHAEVLLELRDLDSAERGLDEAATLLARRGDVANAAFARLVQVRRLGLAGDVDGALQVLGKLSLAEAPARLVALARLTAADLAMKRADGQDAERCLAEARSACAKAGIPALASEIERAERQLAAPVARLYSGGQQRTLGLGDLRAVFAAGDLLIDACRREVRLGARITKLASRPLLFQLLLALAEKAPGEVARDALITRVFAARRVNDSHRVRLRVEIGRLRRLLGQLAGLDATAGGFALTPRAGRAVAILLPAEDGEASALWALLRGGEAWPTSALALAVGKSQRAVQRALAALEQEGKVRACGAGRARRWVVTPAAGITTTLLLVAKGSLS